MPKISIIGAGAAGCLCAIQVRRLLPDAQVTVYEAGRRTLAKVAVTGGGRCNITNTFEEVSSMADVYPRGARLMERLFHSFGPQQTRRWFEAEGVSTVAEGEGRCFPASQSAAQVVSALNGGMHRAGVAVRTSRRLESLEPDGGQWKLHFNSGEERADAVVITTGGSPGGPVFLNSLEMEMVPCVPSLFSFNIPGTRLTSLMGTSVHGACVKLAGTRLSATGDLLITHWGLSGPAVLRLSSYAARELYGRGYRAGICVNWTGGADAAGWISRIRSAHPAKLCSSVSPDGLPSRLWEYLLERASLRSDMRWSELGQKGANRLAAVLTADEYAMDGKSRFTEEFVTCGGVSLKNVSPASLESVRYPGLFFAGEVLDIDAVTGGFNLQAAWTTGHTVATALALKFKSGHTL